MQTAQAQIKLGDNPGSIDPNALLELESTTKGFLLPRMTTIQRLAISSPSEGMMVYDLTANCTYIYRASGGAWYSLCSADSLTASNGLTKVGRDIQLGGTLNQATNINQQGNNLNVTGNGNLGVGTNSPTNRLDVAPTTPGTDDPLRVRDLRTGSSTDSIVTVNAITGIIRKRTLADVLQNQDDYVWKLDGNLTTAVRSLGTKSNFALPIITNNTERMRITATGEVGIGTTSPTNRLTVEATADPLKLVGLQTAAMTDSLLTFEASTGVVRKITIDSVASRGIVAENGITKTGNVVRLGGSLNRPTTVTADATNTLALAGLQSGSATDSVVVQNGATGVLKKMTMADVAAAGVTANNGLTKTGNNIKLGGALVEATTVTTTGTNTLAVAGLQGSSSADSVVMADASTGVLRRMKLSDVGANAITADNGLTKNGNNIKFGGALTQATTLTTDATNTLAVAGLQGGASTDSVLVQNSTNNVIRRMTMADVAASGITANNGLTKTGNNIKLGGALVEATTVTTTGTNTLAVAGLQGSSSADSVVMADASTGVLRRMKLSDVGANAITADNGLTKNGNNIKFGGALTQATTLTTDATNTLAVAGLQGGASTDSVLVQNSTNNVVRRMTMADVAASGITANNGLTKTGNNIKLGGTLVEATTVVTSGTNTLALTGLQTAAMTDSILTQEASTGKVRKITMDSIASRGIVAENGLTKEGNVIRLGGTLNRATTVAQAGNNFQLTGGQVSIGTTSTNARLHVGGSMAMPISTQTGAYTATLDDHTIIANCTGGGFTLTLPAASSCAGRTYVIIKGDATTNVLTFSSAIRLSLSQTMPSVNYNVRLHVQSDGTDWWLIARF
jgi:hypothetical protein